MNRLLRRARGADREGGAALVAVIGIAAAFAIISVTLVSTSVYAASTSGATRAGVQVQAATEQGIDVTLDALNATALRGSEASFPCQLNHSFSTPGGTVDVSVDITYRSIAGATFQCPAPAGTELAAAIFTARGSSTVMAGNGAANITKVVQQELQLLPAGSSGPLFGFGVFSGADLDTTNNFKVIDGGAHTNAMFRCTSAAKILGPVTAVGGASINNDCVMNGLWTGGNVACSSSPLIDGALVTVGTASLSNTCTVVGDVTAGGNITLEGTGRTGYPRKIGGNVTSAIGTITLQPSVRIAGSAQAGSTIRRDDSGTITATHVAGSVIPNTPSTVPVPPPAQDMPAITWAKLTPPGTPVLDVKTWLHQNSTANGGSYSPTDGNACTADGASWSVRGPVSSPTAPTVIDARACPTLTFGNLDLKLTTDLTIVASKFDSYGGLRVTSTKPGSNAKLRIIVPLPSGASTCSGVGNGTISFTSGGTDLGSNVDVFLYSNGRVSLTNSVIMRGSIYGCETQFSNNSTITYADMTPPGMNPPPNPLYEFRPTVRFDLAGNA